MGVGKTTAADRLVEVYGFQKINMKDALMREMRDRLPRTLNEIVEIMNTLKWDGMDIWTVDKLFKIKPPLFRALMQEYGTEVRRADDPYHWTKKWARTASECDKHVCVDDIRFLNEAECVKNAGGVLVRLQRFDIEGGGSHASEKEQELIKADYTISTEKGEFEDFYKKLDYVVSHAQTPHA